MGLAHCPLCVGLAIFSVLRCGASGLLLCQLIRPQPDAAAGPARHSLRWRPAI
ncbi:MAG: hypothetical protein WCQ20_10655 [Synechococcaceae cyanobacterium ELA739]